MNQEGNRTPSTKRILPERVKLPSGIVSYPYGKIRGEKPSGDNSASCSTFGRRDHNDVPVNCIVSREQWIHKVASYRLCLVCASTLPCERRTLYPSVAANDEARRFLPKFVTIFSFEAGKLPPPSRETRIVLLGSRIRKVGQHSGVISYCQSVRDKTRLSHLRILG